jgi:hypothetical protein
MHEELRAVYHFVKRCVIVVIIIIDLHSSLILISMTTLHPFLTSHESVLPIWSPAAQQSRLSNPST